MPTVPSDGADHPSHAQTFTLPRHLTIETAEEVAAALKTQAANGGDVALDASAVEVMTSPGLQLLIALSKTLAATQARWQLCDPRPALQPLLQEAGLHDHIHLSPQKE